MAIQGYTNFIFVNQNGNVQNQDTMNKALRRIIRDCNEKVLDIYTDATKDFKKKEMLSFEEFINKKNTEL